MSKKSDIETMRALVAKWDKQQAAKGKKAKKAKNTFAADMRSKREIRWTEGRYASSGMTSAQRRKVAAKLTKKVGGQYTTRQWNAACKAFKAGDFR